jgi:predicted RND superfamily exporter protein
MMSHTIPRLRLVGVVLVVLVLWLTAGCNNIVFTTGHNRNIVSDSTVHESDGDTDDVFECRGNNDTVYIDVVYDPQDPEKVSDSDQVYECERVYDQTGKEVPSLENLPPP